ncbi:Sortase family protein [Microbacterium ginsengisoli]|jgi:sortase A|uniref:Class E sortase n=1 Tax=Microbacterium ginsengisoli TaxID=400772 RepID=A0A0F0LX60_9MICO|nr:Sortase family protein [Microbacterium ginsengisoli]MBN9208431.1 class E sortase [Microbacterium ginsengisoli]HAN24188.1 class E sortase [Microbacterium ginsengisoli]
MLQLRGTYNPSVTEPEPPLRRHRRAVASSSETSASPQAPRRHRVSVIGVIGEILITAGVLALLYVSWQMWWGDSIIGAQQNSVGNSLSQQWQTEATTEPSPSPTTSGEPVTAAPPDLPQPANAQIFATMHIPRFGSDYNVAIAGGVTRQGTLDPIGIGHYPGTQMPGQEGNFALAAHRTTFGAPFHRIADLHVGDAIVVETPDGWYTYRFRTLEYVKPTAVDVLLPVPQVPDVPASGRYMTMTSCSPMYSADERIVAYSVFESFTPRSAGPPASLTEVSP